MDLWKPVRIEKNNTYFWEIGPLKLWLQKNIDEYLIGFEQSPEDTAQNSVTAAGLREKPETVTWNRFVYNNETDIIQVLPTMHDRAVLVGSEIPVKILPQSRALFFISVPIWLRVYAGKNKKAQLTEIPTVVLSNTWFGDTISGELCYGLKTRARRSLETMETLPNKVICPVQAKNLSQEQLDFQKLLVHVEHLKIYQGKTKLWTNEVTITYFSTDQPSQIDYSRKTPTFEEGCSLLSEERIPPDTSLLKKSFSFFKQFTNF
jgi:hypothetical protein